MGKRIDEILIPQLYRMPWSKSDNHNGWIEVTTFCNMKCPGCYRGCYRENRQEKHKPFEEIKKEIILLKKIRNSQTITLSGGECLMHPKIFEMIKFIREQGLHPAIITNGKLLTKELLIKLKKCGLGTVMIGVDSLKEPDKGNTEKELNEVRQKYTDLVDDVGGLKLGFAIMVNKKNLKEINDFLGWFYKNSTKTQSSCIVPKIDVVYDEKKMSNFNQERVGLQEISKEIWEKYPDLKYCSFLGSQAEFSKIRWLWSIQIFLNGQSLGYVGKKVPEFLETRYHLKHGKYFFSRDKKDYSIIFPKFLILCWICKEKDIFKKALKNILKNPLNLFRKYYFQQIFYNIGPDFVDGKRDFCEGCPDATLYRGNLVPSCILEEIKKFGKPYELKEKFIK